MDHLKLTIDKLSIEAISELVINDSCGAVSLFVGTTRDNFEGKKVVRLEYEAYEPMALKSMKSICDEMRNKWSTLHGIAIYHRLGNVPCGEASIVIAVSSPHRRESLDAVAFCIDTFKGNVPVWKKEVYEGSEPVWKENVECVKRESIKVDNSLVQINVNNEELTKRIQNFIERKREQVNMSNIIDFIPGKSEMDDEESCARWGPQTVPSIPKSESYEDTTLPQSIRERVLAVEAFVNNAPVSTDVYQRLKAVEDKIAYLHSISPEYAQFWKRNQQSNEIKQEPVEYTYSADDIDRKIELLEKLT
ncbi:unnamed protein product [Leptidea sinapis]|uniref:Molybdopterin synthase catalytic subunit n=1 Tax=Leptidea sinapis TaxID=189913 RepID=A0A5E4PT70_9NEOP|nr:unnamed protein product [Leptidea sinapis]